MERRFLYLATPARNPQRRPVLTHCGRPPRADEGNGDGSGAVSQRLGDRRRSSGLASEDFFFGAVEPAVHDFLALHQGMVLVADLVFPGPEAAARVDFP